ncbi:MAG TPA: prepilin-type N-terminal cleavage/methylation domain-containing protein [archaeon]|nr:prepilin-type N-terminal cleavage/methylation domain-containing protein [archaeon]
MRHSKGFSLIEIIVAIAIMAIMAAAVVPVMINRMDQARYVRMEQDLQSIYEATMGTPSAGYFGYVGDMGKLLDSIPQLMNGTGQGTDWHGPYLALGGKMHAADVYGSPYVMDSIPVRVRSYGPNKTSDSGGGDDIVYPENPLKTFKGQLEVQVYINGRLITDAPQEQVTAKLSYSDKGMPATMDLVFSTGNMSFSLPDSVHQGIHALTVKALKAVQDGETTANELVTILPGSKAKIQVTLEDADYMTRYDTDLNGNGVPDRMEDQDGDGIPDNMDPDIDGDGVPNAIDADPLDPTVGGGGGGAVAPMVNSVSPTFGYQSTTGLAVTIDGSYFEPTSTVTFSGSGITVQSVNFGGSTQLVATIDISGTATIGLRNVTVNNPSSGLSGTKNNAFEVLAPGGAPAPSITQVVPNSVTQGETGRMISIQGQNFQSGCTVTFPGLSGITIASGPTRLSTNEVQLTVNVSGTATPTTGTIRVTNPDSKWAEKAFSVTQVQLFISQINPTSMNRNSTIWATVTGSGFLTGVTASTSGSPLSVQAVNRVSATRVDVQLQASFTLTGVDRFVILTNPGGGSDQISFHINGLF